MKTLPITSSSNPKLKNAIRLQSSRGRSQQNRIIIYGQREILRASAKIPLLEIFVDADRAEAVAELELGLNARATPPAVYSLPSNLFEKLAYGDRNDGVIAVAGRPASDLESLSVNDDALLVVVEATEKPGNLGAIFRSADGAGADGVIVSDAGTDVFHPNSIRSSLGTVFSVPFAIGSGDDVRNWLNRNQVQVLCAHPEASKTYFDEDLTGRTAIVLGNEASGLSEAWLNSDHRKISLPMMGIADSLNLSVSAAILLFESRRQRTVGKK